MSNCSECDLDGRESPVVGICLSCGALLCRNHRREPLASGSGGTRFSCGHAIP